MDLNPEGVVAEARIKEKQDSTQPRWGCFWGSVHALTQGSSNPGLEDSAPSGHYTRITMLDARCIEDLVRRAVKQEHQD